MNGDGGSCRYEASRTSAPGSRAATQGNSPSGPPSAPTTRRDDVDGDVTQRQCVSTASCFSERDCFVGGTEIAVLGPGSFPARYPSSTATRDRLPNDPSS